MLHPTIDELTKGKYNRYELALATAKCARIITEEYVQQHATAERPSANSRDAGGIDKELRDEKAVKVAIGRLYNGLYEIDEHAGEKEAAAAEENGEAEAVAEEAVEAETAEAAEDTDETAEEAAPEETEEAADAE